MCIRKNKRERVKAKVKKKRRILCPNCGSGCHIGSAGEVYSKIIPGKIRELLICNNYPKCDSYVAVNRKRGSYGLPANRKVRRLRRMAHIIQDRLIASGQYTRDELYEIMRKEYRLPSTKAHIRYFDEFMCRRLVEVYRKLISAVPKAGITSENITVDGDFIEYENHINFYIEAWFDIWDWLNIRHDENSEDSIDLYADYFPSDGDIHVYYIIQKSDESGGRKVPITDRLRQSERSTLLNHIFKMFRCATGMSIEEYWREAKQGIRSD